MVYPNLLEKLISFYKKLPTIGEKSAERLALATIELDDDEIVSFSKNIVLAKQNLVPCKICNNLTDKETCSICNDSSRNKNLICVIEDYKSVYSFEKAGNYKGMYHILNGLISPMKDIGPEDINIRSLIDRIDKLDNPEIILALKSSIEGETTTLYIKKIFEDKNVTISRLSYGIPMGAEIDYLDVLTLDKALQDRKIL
ncbi:MAG: recombination protein RecR [Mollicutes bacterium]|nr:recombination protein RecR [Mollicutes bacterium]